MKQVKGDLIQLALAGEFDVIAHGCNCFSTQKSGIAKQMVEHFGTDKFEMETRIVNHPNHINKLGNIDWDDVWIGNSFVDGIVVINCYTQYNYGVQKRHADYDAIALCMRKINTIFAGKHIGLPKIGSGLAGGDWKIISGIIEQELNRMNVTIVEYEK